jgi:hypothetical protein
VTATSTARKMESAERTTRTRLTRLTSQRGHAAGATTTTRTIGDSRHRHRVDRLSARAVRLPATRRATLNSYVRLYYDVFELSGQPEVANTFRSQYAAIKGDHDAVSRGAL